MRLHDSLRARQAKLAVGALAVSTFCATAPSLQAAEAQTASPQTAPALKFKLNDSSLKAGERLVATGSAQPQDAGKPVALEYRKAGASWRVLATSTVAADGSYRVDGRVRYSGDARVSQHPAGAVLRVASATPAAAAATPARAVKVSPHLTMRARRLHLLVGTDAVVTGKVSPAAGRRTVLLQRREGTSWKVIATVRTGRSGAYRVAYSPARAGTAKVRVAFRGDRVNASATTKSVSYTGYRAGGASWYGGGGATACGRHARYGVAHKSLPCGTRVTLRYGTRSVVATVVDRGPYVGGREWDLTGSTRRALGFGDVGTVWSSI